MALWNLASILRLDVDAQDNGAVGGKFTYQGVTYPVTGEWRASGNQSGGVYSVLRVTGQTGVEDPADLLYIAASGIVYGPGNAPTQIDIQGAVTSSLHGTIESFNRVLLP